MADERIQVTGLQNFQLFHAVCANTIVRQFPLVPIFCLAHDELVFSTPCQGRYQHIHQLAVV